MSDVSEDYDHQLTPLDVQPGPSAPLLMNANSPVVAPSPPSHLVPARKITSKQRILIEVILFEMWKVEDDNGSYLSYSAEFIQSHLWEYFCGSGKISQMVFHDYVKCLLEFKEEIKFIVRLEDGTFRWNQVGTEPPPCFQ